MKTLASILRHLLIGGLFGVGLVLSDMINPARVTGFHDVTGAWDPTLLFVMGGALLVSIPLHQLILKRPRHKIPETIKQSRKLRPDRQLIVGAILFGIGWGLSGVCPGPAIAQLANPQSETFVFLLSVIGGQYLSPILAGIFK